MVTFFSSCSVESDFIILYYTGVLIGTLPTEQHQVSGQFHIIDSKTLFIEDFNYDGLGPGIATLMYAHSYVLNKSSFW